MSLEPVAWLCKRARNLPKDVKRQIAYYGRHATASLIKELGFQYSPVWYEPLSHRLNVVCGFPTKWLGPLKVSQPLQRWVKRFWICRSKYHPDYNGLPAWATEEVRSPDQQKNIF